MSKEIKSGTTVGPRLVRIYIFTLGITAIIAVISIIVLLNQTQSCSHMVRAMQILWAIIAVIFLASTVMAGTVVWRTFPGTADRLIITIGYGVVMLATFFMIAFASMVAFNC